MLKAKDAINMSVSLLGALFMADHIRFRQIGQGREPWDGETVDAEKLIADNVEEITQPHFGVVWFATKINNKTIPYKKEITKSSEFESFKKDVYRVSGIVLGEFESYKKTDNPLKATTRLNHCPTKLNYWHFTFDTYPADTEKPIMNEKSWRKRLLDKTAKDILRFSYKLCEDCIVPAIPESIWLVA